MKRRMMAAAMHEEGESFPERVFRMHGGLRFYILWLLDDSNLNGSEIIDEIERQTSGMWRPSPGSIYPLLRSLEDEMLVAKNESGRYSITGKGKEQTRWLKGKSTSDEERKQDKVGESIQQMENLAEYIEDNLGELGRFVGRLDDLKKRIEDIVSRVK